MLELPDSIGVKYSILHCMELMAPIFLTERTGQMNNTVFVSCFS